MNQKTVPVPSALAAAAIIALYTLLSLFRLGYSYAPGTCWQADRGRRSFWIWEKLRMWEAFPGIWVIMKSGCLSCMWETGFPLPGSAFRMWR